MDNKYATPEELPGELFDSKGNRIFIRGYLLSAEQSAAKAMSRTVSTRMLNQALREAVDLAGEDFVNGWLKAAYRLIVEGETNANKI